jgi:3-carboxy-cis,cis-muconate cycloisomerase
MEQEHERAAGAWQAEWGIYIELLGLVGSATSWSLDLLTHLQIHEGRMAENLAALAAAGVEEARDPVAHLQGAAELVDRALAARLAQRNESGPVR